MPTNTLQSLLDWMAGPESNVMWGWDAIAALARGKVNLLLAGDALARLDSDNPWPVFSGEVIVSESRAKNLMHGIALGVPRLSFENATVDDSRARLTMPVIGGVRLDVKKAVDRWRVTRIDEFDPLQGPVLSLDLQLAQLPGQVQGQTWLGLDLRLSDNPRLGLEGTDVEQQRAGEFFKALIDQWPEDLSVLRLGVLDGSPDQPLPLQAYRLRSQLRRDQSLAPSASADGDGALLLFMCLAGHEEGGSVGASFRYLIPDDEGADFSATLLFDQQLKGVEIGQPGTLSERCARLIDSRDFTVEYGQQGQWRSMQANAGALAFEATTRTLPGFSFKGEGMTASIASPALAFAANSSTPLRIEQLEDQQVSIEWGSSSTLGSAVSFSSASRNDWPGAMIEEEYFFHLSALYAPDDNDPARLQLRTWHIDIDARQPPMAPLPAGTDMEALAWQAFTRYVGRQIVRLLGPVIKAGLAEALKTGFRCEVSLMGLFKNTMTLDFRQAIHTDVMAVPRDIGVFGRVDAQHGAPQVEPLQPVLVAGGTQVFSAQPASQDLQWSVASLQPPDGEAGSIDAQGLYRAPTAAALQGRFQRLRVSATEAAGGQRSDALVTVVRQGLTVNPLITECNRGEQALLQAGVLGDGDLEWTILDPVEGLSGRLILPEGSNRTCIYQATDQQRPGCTYVPERIEVRDSLTGATAHLLVLVLLATSSVSIDCAEDPALTPDQLRLQATLNGQVLSGVQWRLAPGGTGTIDAEGLYTRDPDGPLPFVLVLARVEGAGMIFEGHLIVPLPLSRFSGALAAVTRH